MGTRRGGWGSVAKKPISRDNEVIGRVGARVGSRLAIGIGELIYTTKRIGLSCRSSLPTCRCASRTFYMARPFDNCYKDVTLSDLHPW
jgi:hypothetical protein